MQSPSAPSGGEGKAVEQREEDEDKGVVDVIASEIAKADFVNERWKHRKEFYPPVKPGEEHFFDFWDAVYGMADKGIIHKASGFMLFLS